MRNKTDLSKVLWSSKDKWRFNIAGIGLLIGFLLSLSLIQLHVDIDRLFEDKDKYSSYIIINKPISILNALISNEGFLEEELEEIQQKDFVESASIFQSNTFRVSASTSGQYQFFTELFFESIEEEFIDNPSPDFEWKDGQEIIPIIVSRDFLNLYNFGFAASQGLPQLSGGTLRLLTVNIHLEGQNKKKTLKGRVVGLSDRIASLIVPKTFMDWANKNYGTGDFKGSRMMLKVDDPSAPALIEFLHKSGYENNKDRMKVNKIGAILKVISVALVGLGILVILLSTTIFLSIFEIQMSLAKRKIELLLDLGYLPNRISFVYLKRLLYSVAFIYLLSISALYLMANQIHKWLNGNGFELDGGVSNHVVIISLLIVSTIFIVCYRIIIKEIKKV